MTTKFMGEWASLVALMEEAAESNEPLVIVLSEDEYQKQRTTKLRDLGVLLSKNVYGRLCLLESYPVQGDNHSIDNRPVLLVTKYGRCF